MKTCQTSHSSMAAVMGATVRISGPPQALYLVVGRESVEPIVLRAGGQIAVRLTSDKVLAILSYERFFALKSDRRISRIGPVNLDMDRFKRFSQNLAKIAAP